MDLVFLRHGEPAWSVDGYSQRDPYLTERGHEQADLAAKRLSSHPDPITDIIVSPAVRALETAQPLVDVTGIEPQVIDDIVEIRMPPWEGELEATVRRLFMEAKERPPEEWWDGLTGGETFRDFHNRVTGAMLDLLSARGVVPHREQQKHLWHAEGAPGIQPRAEPGIESARIVIVAHGGTNAVALGFLLGLDPTPWEWERFILGHASVARIKAIPLAGEHVFSLREFNDREHLPREMRTR